MALIIRKTWEAANKANYKGGNIDEYVKQNFGADFDFVANSTDEFITVIIPSKSKGNKEPEIWIITY